MEQIAAFIGQLIWQAQQGLAGIGWSIGETWDRIGDVGHKGLAVFLFFAVALIVCGVVEKKWPWSDEEETEEKEPITQPLPVVSAEQIAEQAIYDPVKEAGGWRSWEELSTREQHDLSGKIRFPYDYDAAEEFDMIVEQHLEHIGWILQEERGEQA